MLHHKERHFDERKQSFIIKHNIRGESIDEWVTQYQVNETYRKLRRPDSVILSHEILSWHREDTQNISLEKLEAMAREYISLRNPNGIYIAIPHTDKDHYHIHICAAGVEYHTGKAMRMSKAEFTKLKQDIQNFQREKFPELSHSVVEHGKSEKKAVALPSDKEYQIKRRTGRATDKEQVLGMLKDCYHRAVSKEDFFELLKENSIKIYNRSGKTTGIIFHNRKFRFSRLGFVEKLNELNLSQERSKDLERIRNIQESKQLKKSINHERN